MLRSNLLSVNEESLRFSGTRMITLLEMDIGLREFAQRFCAIWMLSCPELWTPQTNLHTQVSKSVSSHRSIYGLVSGKSRDRICPVDMPSGCTIFVSHRMGKQEKSGWLQKQPQKTSVLTEGEISPLLIYCKTPLHQASLFWPGTKRI